MPRWYTILAILLFVMFWMIGCAKDPIGDSAPRIKSVMPLDGVAGVSPYASISVVFSVPMDTTALRRGFHLLGSPQLPLWLDSLRLWHLRAATTNGQPPPTWLDSLSLSGQLRWNMRLDSLVFEPKPPLSPGTPHAVILTGDVLSLSGHKIPVDTLPYGAFVNAFVTGPE